MIITGGKMGYVYALNARSGALLWKTPVGEHNGHDGDSLLALSHKLKIKLPYTMLPGSLGGVLSNMAVADGSVYVATIDLPITATSLNSVNGDKAAGPATGEVEALSLAAGQVEWDTKVPAMPLGAATVSTDLIFTTLYNGVLIALSRETGVIVYRHRLPTSANAPIAVFGNTALIPAGGPQTSSSGGAATRSWSPTRFPEPAGPSAAGGISNPRPALMSRHAMSPSVVRGRRRARPVSLNPSARR